MEDNNEEIVQEASTDIEQTKKQQIEKIKESQMEQPQEKETLYIQEQEKEPQIEQNLEQEKETRREPENTNIQSYQYENFEPQTENNQNIINTNKDVELLNGNIIEEFVELKKEPTIENKIILPEEFEGEVEDSDYAKDLATPIPLSKQENYTLKNILVPKYSFNELTQPQLTKIYELKEATEEAIAKTVKNKKSTNLVKALVSKKKNRFFMMDSIWI